MIYGLKGKAIMKAKNFINTLFITGPIVTVAGLILEIISTILRDNANAADQASGSGVLTDHLFEEYLIKLGTIMMVFGFIMLLTAIIWYCLTYPRIKKKRIIKRDCRDCDSLFLCYPEKLRLQYTLCIYSSLNWVSIISSTLFVAVAPD